MSDRNNGGYGAARKVRAGELQTVDVGAIARRQSSLPPVKLTSVFCQGSGKGGNAADAA
jgi:hypothetical protein